MNGKSQLSTSMQSIACSMCRKKILFEYKCPCEKNFCVKCRVPEIHKCTFDFHTNYKKRLEKENPIVIGEKLDKI